MTDGGGGRRRGGRVRVAHATRVRDALGAPSRCGGPRERGPHTCKRTLLKGRAEPKNRSLKCNDIVVFNARLFKTGPFVFLEPARYFWRLPDPLGPPVLTAPSRNLFSITPFLAHARDEEGQIAICPSLFDRRCCCSEVSSYTLQRFFYERRFSSAFCARRNIMKGKTVREWPSGKSFTSVT